MRTAVDADLGHGGGISGAIMDDHLLPANSKEVQVYRAAIAMSLIAAAGEQTINSKNEAEDYVWALSRVAGQLNIMYAVATINGDCARMVVVCPQYAAEFETYVPGMETLIYKLALAVIPREKFREIADDIISQDYLGLALDVVRTAGDSVLAGHQMAASYRSAIEGIAYATTRPAGSFNRTQDAVVAVRQALVNRDAVFTPQIPDFDLIFHLAVRSCTAVASRAGDPAGMKRKCESDMKFNG